MTKEKIAQQKIIKARQLEIQAKKLLRAIKGKSSFRDKDIIAHGSNIEDLTIKYMRLCFAEID